MNLYDLHQSPERLHRHADADIRVPRVFWDKYRYNTDELKRRERAIATSARYSCWYAAYVIRRRWPPGEAGIIKNPQYSYLYARYVIKGRWPLGEPAIATSAEYSYWYAIDVIKGRWLPGEPAIANSVEYNRYYKQFLAKNEPIHLALIA